MFKFNFDLDDDHEGTADIQIDASVPYAVSGLGCMEESVKEDASEEISLDDLVSGCARIPPQFDYYVTSFTVYSLSNFVDCRAAPSYLILSAVRHSIHRVRSPSLKERSLRCPIPADLQR